MASQVNSFSWIAFVLFAYANIVRLKAVRLKANARKGKAPETGTSTLATKRMDFEVVIDGQGSPILAFEIWDVGSGKFAQHSDRGTCWMGRDVQGDIDKLRPNAEGIRELIQSEENQLGDEYDHSVLKNEHATRLYEVKVVKAVSAVEKYDKNGKKVPDGTTVTEPLQITWKKGSTDVESFGMILKRMREQSNGHVWPPLLHDYVIEPPDDMQSGIPDAIAKLVQERGERTRDRGERTNVKKREKVSCPGPFFFCFSSDTDDQQENTSDDASSDMFELDRTTITIILKAPRKIDASFKWWCNGLEVDCMCAKLSPRSYSSLRDFTPVLAHVLSSSSGSPFHEAGTDKLQDIAMMLAGRFFDILVDISKIHEMVIDDEPNYICQSGSVNHNFQSGSLSSGDVAKCLKLNNVQIVETNSVTKGTLVLCATPYNETVIATDKLTQLYEKLEHRIRFNNHLRSIHTGNERARSKLVLNNKVKESSGFWSWWKTPSDWKRMSEFFKVEQGDPLNTEFLYHGMRGSYFRGNRDRPGLQETGYFDLLAVGVRNHGWYGAGIYLTDSSCEAFSYAWGSTKNPSESDWYVLVVTQNNREVAVAPNFKYSRLREVQNDADRILSPSVFKQHQGDRVFGGGYKVPEKYYPSYGLRNTPDENSAFSGPSTLDALRRDKFECVTRTGGLPREIVVFNPDAIRIHYVVKFEQR